MYFQTSKNKTHRKQQSSLNKERECDREVNSFLVSNINKRSIKLSKAKSTEVDSDSVSIRETLRIILRNGFQYFTADNFSVPYYYENT